MGKKHKTQEDIDKLYAELSELRQQWLDNLAELKIAKSENNKLMLKLKTLINNLE